MINYFTSKTKERGFSLIEVIVAMGIIFTGLVAVLTLAAQNAKGIRTASNRVIASNLAQEAIEVVVNIRDSNWVAGRGWRENIPSTTQGIVNYNSTAVAEVLDQESFCLGIAGGFYQHASPPCNTIFNRHVEIIDRSETIDGNPVSFIEVRAIVEWQNRGLTQTITLENHLYDWR